MFVFKYTFWARRVICHSGLETRQRNYCDESGLNLLGLIWSLKFNRDSLQLETIGNPWWRQHCPSAFVGSMHKGWKKNEVCPRHVCFSLLRHFIPALFAIFLCSIILRNISLLSIVAQNPFEEQKTMLDGVEFHTTMTSWIALISFRSSFILF
jgi:hypothetical protein